MARDTTKAREVMLSKVSKYEEPYQYYLLNQNKGESMRAIARKFGVDDKGLGKYIKTLESEQKSAQSAQSISNAVEGIKGGLEVIKNLQESAIPRDNQLAQKAIATLEDYYPQMRGIFASIQNRVLNALDRETQTMESMGELTIDNIAKVQSVLKSANDTNAFIPKTPLVAVQNNINNQNANIGARSVNPQGEVKKPNNEIEFKISFIGNDDKKENGEAIEGEVIDN